LYRLLGLLQGLLGLPFGLLEPFFQQQSHFSFQQPIVTNIMHTATASTKMIAIQEERSESDKCTWPQGHTIPKTSFSKQPLLKGVFEEYLILFSFLIK
jgi:hypothetical protein